MLPLTTPTGSTYRMFYKGPVGVSGVNVQQSWDLSVMPKSVREDPTFRDNFIIFARQISSSLSDVSPDIDFLPSIGAPDQLVLTLSAITPLDQIDLEAWYIHSITR